MVKSNIKIVVVYHKKAPLFKSDVLVPIHAGRSVAKEKSKDGFVSNGDLKWLQNHMIGDDTGDNISYLNRYLNEMTAVYWMWKNYDKLGNPDYIGLCHYRRFFDFGIISRPSTNLLYKQKTLNTILGKRDFIAIDSSESETTFEKWSHHKTPGVNLDNLGICFDAVKKNNPKIGDIMEKFLLNSKKSHLCNMFIMKKQYFFEYCEWIFPILFFCQKKIKIDYKSEHPNKLRILGYLAELLTSTYISFLESRKLSHIYVPICQPEEFHILKKIKRANGRRHIYFCGIKVFSYKKPAK